MENTQIGMYMRLLRHAWNADPPCSIPDNLRELRSITRCDRPGIDESGEEHDEFETWCAEVLACFEKREDGRLYQKRLEFEYQKAMGLHAARVKGGLATWKKR